MELEESSTQLYLWFLDARANYGTMVFEDFNTFVERYKKSYSDYRESILLTAEKLESGEYTLEHVLDSWNVTVSYEVTYCPPPHEGSKLYEWIAIYHHYDGTPKTFGFAYRSKDAVLNLMRNPKPASMLEAHRNRDVSACFSDSKTFSK